MALVINVDDQYKLFVKNNLNRVVANAEKVLKSKKIFEVDLSVITDRKMQDLNRRYRGIDKTTDVLSFSFFDMKKSDGFILPGSNQGKLGQIFISYQRVLAQAKTFNIDFQDEALKLFVHGLVHLFGYDHKNDTQEARMNKIEKQIIN